MKPFVLILFLIIGIGFFSDERTDARTGIISLNENILNEDYITSCASSQNYFVSPRNNYNNNKASDITNAYNFFTRLSDKYSRINNLLSEETLAYLKSLIRHKSSINISLIASSQQPDSSTSLYKLLNPCDFYTYHNHRIII